MGVERTLKLYESRNLTDGEFYPYDPGEYIFPLEVLADSLFSVVSTKAIGSGSSVSVLYQIRGPGSGQDSTEWITVATHDTLNSANTNTNLVVSKVSNKMRCLLTVSGAQATVGIYAMAKGSPASSSTASGNVYLPDTILTDTVDVLFDSDGLLRES